MVSVQRPASSVQRPASISLFSSASGHRWKICEPEPEADADPGPAGGVAFPASSCESLVVFVSFSCRACNPRTIMPVVGTTDTDPRQHASSRTCRNTHRHQERKTESEPTTTRKKTEHVLVSTQCRRIHIHVHVHIHVSRRSSASGRVELELLYIAY